MLAINSLTFVDWAASITSRPETADEDRIAVLVDSYFDFATTNRNLWMAIYDHRLPPGVPFPDRYAQRRGVLTAIPPAKADLARPLTRSLLATVHGHCLFALNGTFALL